MVFVMGDFNILPPGETATKLDSTFQTIGARETPQKYPETYRWEKALQGLTELHQFEPTPVRVDGDVTHLTASRLDRVYISTPAWALMQMRATARVTIPVTRCHKEKISDHAPVRTSLSCKSLLPKHMRPIPKWLAKHPIFKQVLADLEERAGLDCLSTADRWVQHKKIIRQASEIAARRCLSKVAKTNDEQLQGILQASRAIWFDMPHMVPKIITTPPSLKDVIYIDSHGHAAIKDHAKFQSITAGIVNGSITAENDDAKKSQSLGNARLSSNNRRQMLSRWAKLWAPYDKQLILHGIELPNGSLATTPADKARALSEHWGEVFKRKDIDERLAMAVMRRFTEKIDMSSERMPSDDDFEAFWRRAKHSATGPDGIPYCAWATSGYPAAKTMRLLMWEMMQGQPAPNGFNDSFAVFPR
jgi:hypothetical protein